VFLAPPPLSALSIVAACLLFLPAFPALAQLSLIGGSFAGALGSGRAITPEVLSGARPVTDSHNVFSILYAETRMSDWGQLLGQWSPHVLVN